ncbi:hypothetical protein [Nitrosomonas ureae]|uniref:hypothetical protein n=1 Tax=Nitrosomonas ureae TaxID=44577 RepID=UPI0011604A9B|nr:hypothetical protein [Nitrosomonas ureae]
MTADDLKTEQNANRRQREQLGQAIGTGIVNGLEVSLIADGSNGKSPVVSVTAGLALNAKGQAVSLAADVQVALAREIEPLPVEAGLFAECTPPKTGTVPRDKGAYILLASPTSGFRELAPVRGFSDGKVVSCNSRYAVEGVKFRLEELKITDLTRLSQDTRDGILELMTKTDPANLSKLRNWLAHICFGTEEQMEFLRDPFARISGKSPYTGYGAIDALHAKDQLTDCDVPLALLYWTPNGVQFLDMWSVRRKVTKSNIADRRVSEAEAVISQFQFQIEQIRNDPKGNPGAIEAAKCFKYLPSVGVVPIFSTNFPLGFHQDLFFEGIIHHPIVHIEDARVEALMRNALCYPPQELKSRVMVWIYRIRENAQASSGATGQIAAQPYLIFSTGHMPYMGDPHFDVNRWNFSNWA